MIAFLPRLGSARGERVSCGSAGLSERGFEGAQRLSTALRLAVVRCREGQKPPPLPVAFGEDDHASGSLCL